MNIGAGTSRYAFDSGKTSNLVLSVEVCCAPGSILKIDFVRPAEWTKNLFCVRADITKSQFVWRIHENLPSEFEISVQNCQFFSVHRCVRRVSGHRGAMHLRRRSRRGALRLLAHICCLRN